MKRSVLYALALVLALITLAASASAQAVPEFKLGFKALADQLPADVVGIPTENEHFNLSNGNSEQHTTKGLMVWRKADNWTAFTNGYMTWINGPNGVQSRLNTDRFGWERTTDPSPSPTASPEPSNPIGRYARFMGIWGDGTFTIKLNEEGYGGANWKVGHPCQYQETTPCDWAGPFVQGDVLRICDGGCATLQIWEASGDTATVGVGWTNDPYRVPSGMYTLLLLPGGTLRFGGAAGTGRTLACISSAGCGVQ